MSVPEATNTIGDYSFVGGDISTTSSIPPTITSSSFYSVKNIFVPENMIDIYKTMWSNYASIISGSGVNKNNSTNINYTTSDSNTINLTEPYIQSNTYDTNGGILVLIGDSKTIPSFSGKTNLQSIEIPNIVTSLRTNAFAGCTNLTHITIPDSVINIEDGAFSGCTNLTSITIPNGVTSIGASTFAGCTKLSNITIPNSVINIEDGTFSGCTSLTSITIPDSVTSIGEKAFYNCNKLLKITIPNSVTSIGSYAFYNCSGLTSIVIPDSVTSIGSYAFYQCYNLTSVTMSNSVTSIVGYVFCGCSNLTSITIPNSVTKIGNYAFSKCTSLSSITIPDSVVEIGYATFSNCSSLSSITIPDSVVEINSTSLFYYCSNLNEITLKSPIPYPLIDTTIYPIRKININCPFNKNYEKWQHTVKEEWIINYPFFNKTYTKLKISGIASMYEGYKKNVEIRYMSYFNGYDVSDTYFTDIIDEGIILSSEIPQNTSDGIIEREVNIEYQGLTASTKIKQKNWVPVIQTCDVVLNNNWELSTTIANPNENIYEGVYQSYSNKGVNNSAAVMYIDIEGYENFKFYIRSYAESSYDYVMVSQLDTTITSGSSYSNTTLVKAHTRGKQSSTTSISGYTLVEFTEIPEGKHRITVLYRKDSSGNSGDDRGYVLIPKEQ